MHSELTCIVCPIGCRIQIDETENGYIIEGYACPRGKKYALQELEDPRRMVTSTVRVENGFLALVPVKTAEPIPKNLIFDVMTQINSVVVEAPVFLGDVIVKDVAGTGIDIIATRDMPKNIK